MSVRQLKAAGQVRDFPKTSVSQATCPVTWRKPPAARTFLLHVQVVPTPLSGLTMDLGNLLEVKDEKG